jgi:hypothetical protein
MKLSPSTRGYPVAEQGEHGRLSGGEIVLAGAR